MNAWGQRERGRKGPEKGPQATREFTFQTYLFPSDRSQFLAHFRGKPWRLLRNWFNLRQTQPAVGLKQKVIVMEHRILVFHSENLFKVSVAV